MCFLLSSAIHSPLIYCHVWHQLSLLQAVPVKLYDVAFQPHWQQHTHTCMCTRHIVFTQSSNFTQTHDFITHCATAKLAGTGRASPRLVEHLMSDCAFLSSAHEKRQCLLSRAQKGWLAPQLEDRWGIYSFSAAQGGGSVWGCVCVFLSSSRARPTWEERMRARLSISDRFQKVSIAVAWHSTSKNGIQGVQS